MYWLVFRGLPFSLYTYLTKKIPCVLFVFTVLLFLLYKYHAKLVLFFYCIHCDSIVCVLISLPALYNFLYTELFSLYFHFCSVNTKLTVFLLAFNVLTFLYKCFANYGHKILYFSFHPMCFHSCTNTKLTLYKSCISACIQWPSVLVQIPHQTCTKFPRIWELYPWTSLT